MPGPLYPSDRPYHQPARRRTSSTYLCQVRGTQSTIPDGWEIAFRAGATAFLGATGLCLASLLPFDELSGGNLLCLAVLGLGALLGALLVAIGLAQRLRQSLTSVTVA